MENISSLFLKHVSKIETINKLSGGLSNDIFLINGKYIWKKIKNKYLFDHNNEKEIMNKSNEFNLFYHDNDNMCYNFIKGENITREYFHNNLNDIIIKLKLYHGIKVTTETFWEETIPKWLQLLPDKLKFSSKEELNNIYNNITKKINKIKDSNDLVLCHQDVHSANIIKNDEGLHFIDLEFSFTNYYYVDLGNLICEIFTNYQNEVYNYQDINEEIKHKVLKTYFNNEYSDIELDKLNIGILISHFYWCMWGILIDINQEQKEFDYLHFAKSRMESIKNSNLF